MQDPEKIVSFDEHEYELPDGRIIYVTYALSASGEIVMVQILLMEENDPLEEMIRQGEEIFYKNIWHFLCRFINLLITKIILVLERNPLVVFGYSTHGRQTYETFNQFLRAVVKAMRVKTRWDKYAPLMFFLTRCQHIKNSKEL